MSTGPLFEPAVFDFAAAPRIVFGWGRRSEIGGLAKNLGRRAFLLHGSKTLKRTGAIDELVHALTKAGLEVVELGGIFREPEVDDVDRFVADAKSYRPTTDDCVVAVGGGSAMDLAKAVAGLAMDPRSASVVDFLEGVGQGFVLTVPPLPILALPTTAGTGAEATKNAVIACRAPAFKKSLRDHRLVPSIALVDPEWTVGNSRQVTAASGMDAICQSMEAVLTRRAQPMTTALALAGLCGANSALRRAFQEPDHRPSRETMAYTALTSGLALANSGLGLAHGVAAALGARFGVSHGLACAVMLPTALAYNAVDRPAEIALLAKAFLGSAYHDRMPPNETAQCLVDEVRSLNRALQLPDRLSALGVASTDVPEIVKLSAGSSLTGNPRPLSPETLAELLTQLI